VSTDAVAAVSRGPAIGRSGIREVMDLASTLDNVIHLELGEPDFPTPDHVIEAVRGRLAGGAVKYTLSRGTSELREAIAAKVRQRNGIQRGADEVVVTSGGTTAVVESLLACLRPGDGVLVPDPGWPTFTMATQLARGRVVRYPLLAQEGFEPDLDALDRLARDARVLIINTPANPTGAVLRPQTVQRMLELAQRHDLLVISDEVYEDLIFEGEHLSAASCDEDDRVITVFSFSKAYAMTGWRVGYAVAPKPLAEAIVHVQEAVIACPSEVAQWAALAALRGPDGDVERMRASYRERRDAATAPLTEAGLLKSLPRGTFYALVDTSALNADGYEVARRLLLDHRVGVAPGETFGPAGQGLVRISLATAIDELMAGVGRIIAAVENSSTDRGKEA
jgi:aspartate/methionine/tyrosine aminotransferase